MGIRKPKLTDQPRPTPASLIPVIWPGRCPGLHGPAQWASMRE
jgi:hypothetical protein